MYFRLSAALPLVTVAQIALECFTRLTVRTVKALLRGVVVRDVITIRGAMLPLCKSSGYECPYCSATSTTLVTLHVKFFVRTFISYFFQHSNVTHICYSLKSVPSEHQCSLFLRKFYLRLVDWLSDLYKQQWERMLLAYQGVDIGPEEGVSEEEFDSLAFRCGRILEGDMQVNVIFYST